MQFEISFPNGTNVQQNQYFQINYTFSVQKEVLPFDFYDSQSYGDKSVKLVGIASRSWLKIEQRVICKVYLVLLILFT